jgi:hypothetical protein
LSNQISIHHRNLEHVFQWQETVAGDNLTVENYDDLITKAGTAASRLQGASCRGAWSAASQGSQGQEGRSRGQVKYRALECAIGSMDSFALKRLLQGSFFEHVGFLNRYLSFAMKPGSLL